MGRGKGERMEGERGKGEGNQSVSERCSCTKIISYENEK